MLHQINQAVSLNSRTDSITKKRARTKALHLNSENTIGIEVAGSAYTRNKSGNLVNTTSHLIENDAIITKGYQYPNDEEGPFYWDIITEKQRTSIICLVKFLMKKYNLTSNDLFCHEEIQIKTPGEGRVILDLIKPYL